MSLILDALRKSEAERRKAQAAADALAEVPRTPASSLTGLPTWVWPAAAMSAAALVAWLWWGRPANVDAAPPPASTAGVMQPGSTVAQNGIPDAEAPDAALAQAIPHDDLTVAASESPTARAASTLATATPGAAPASAPASAAVRAVPPAPATQSAPPPAPAATPSASPATAAIPAVATSTIATATAPPRPALPSVPTSSGSTRDASAPLPPVTAPAAGSAPTRLADLGTADRQQLPPLKMSLHMWGAESAKRFAIIDGNRVGEGDRVGDAVVESIDQDGVVLAWNGYRLRVPVR